MKCYGFDAFNGLRGHQNAQDALFKHQAPVLTVQLQLIEIQAELQEIKAKASKRARYPLHELSAGIFVYRSVSPQSGIVIRDDAGAEPTQHLCQLYFNEEAELVFQRRASDKLILLKCSVCGVGWASDESATRIPLLNDQN